MTMKLTIKHLFRRGLAWQFRRRVPSDIRSIVGKSEWVVSFGEATIKRRIGALGAVVKRYDADHDIMRRNPFYGVQLRNAGPTKGDREPLSEAQVAKLDEYLRNADGLLPRTRALLWLVRSSTLGPSEAGGLLPPDIITDHEVPHVIVRPNKLRGIKVRSRERVFPLVGPVLEFAEALPAKTFGGNAVSALLNKHLRKAVSDLSPMCGFAPIIASHSTRVQMYCREPEVFRY